MQISHSWFAAEVTVKPFGQQHKNIAVRLSFDAQKEAVSNYCQPELVEGDQFDCQYFDKLNMTIKLSFETASFIDMGQIN